jgi:hypothetical protein
VIDVRCTRRQINVRPVARRFDHPSRGFHEGVQRCVSVTLSRGIEALASNG